MPTLEGKIALVTGGSRGIGRAICLRLAGEGARILLHYYRNREAAEEVARITGSDTELLQANLADPAAIDAMVASLPHCRLDLLINNAGVWKGTPLGATPLALANEILDTNLRAVFWLTQAVLPLLNEGARIINISSVAARTGVAGGRSLYGATKAALEYLTRNWAMELAPRSILVNAVAPGYVETDMTAAHLSDPATYARALQRHPLGRLGTPEDVADVVAFLCSHDARFITGQTLNVSGGFVI